MAKTVKVEGHKRNVSWRGERNLDYEKRFRVYLFRGDWERHKDICKNINVEPIRKNG